MPSPIFLPYHTRTSSSAMQGDSGTLRIVRCSRWPQQQGRRFAMRNVYSVHKFDKVWPHSIRLHLPPQTPSSSSSYVSLFSYSSSSSSSASPRSSSSESEDVEEPDNDDGWFSVLEVEPAADAFSAIPLGMTSTSTPSALKGMGINPPGFEGVLVCPCACLR
ncbi:hypothetical protein M413DRAFT_370341 [Hebeloma cylindrosporum]|uniref:Uncharacterized protein n=1 Tax=Hebeloma cylindrosporum TaxID=76867 RepID=A0A0C2XAF8_HEBCY|nr:hypothetical protein M413DRAFT_370341 [Hebeloma cylindrosporum h7]